MQFVAVARWFLVLCVIAFASSPLLTAQAQTATGTDVAAATIGPPDILLDANVSVPLIELTITNLSAHISLDAKVASLVQLSVGVDIKVDQINLTIKDVQATVHLEARLHEVTKIVESVMSSLNLNPILLALATGLVSAVDGLTGAIGTTTNTAAGTATGATAPLASGR